MTNIQDEYRALLSAILHGGKAKADRTGTGTRSLFGKLIEHDMHFGFPILNGKRINFNAAKTELLWILNGRTDLKYLEDNGVAPKSAARATSSLQQARELGKSGVNSSGNEGPVDYQAVW